MYKGNIISIMLSSRRCRDIPKYNIFRHDRIFRRTVKILHETS